MLDSARFVAEFSTGRTIEDLLKDRGFRSAIERELQIVGEALTCLAKIAPEVARQVSESARIIRFRHILVHGYDILDNAVVWTVITEKLPILIKEVEVLLNDFKG